MESTKKIACIVVLSTMMGAFTLLSTHRRYMFTSIQGWQYETEMSSYNRTQAHWRAMCDDIRNTSLTEQSRDSIMTSSDVRETQRARISNIRRVCRDSTLLDKELYNERMSRYDFLQTKLAQRFYFSPKYKFIYCKVPKVGSTFWSQVFDILHNPGNLSKLLTKSRMAIHNSMDKYYSQLSYRYKTRYPAVIPARNPFSRLYSAFVDKSYLNLMPQLNPEIRAFPHKVIHKGNDSMCVADVTFQEFLDFIIARTQAGRQLNRHWAPISTICAPCSLNVKVVVKHKTNKPDVTFALTQLGIVGDAAEMITSLMYENRTKTTIPGIIQTAYSRVPVKCMSRLDLVRRLWNSFQGQGYIRNCLSFPERLLNVTSSDDVIYVTRVILETMEQNPMSAAEVKSQRMQALVTAYKDINTTTIEHIREIYEDDFNLFSYPSTFPT